MKTEQQKQAAREYAREYRKRNKDKLLVESRKRYQENREANLANKKKYYQENREQIRAKQKKHYDENRCRVLESNRQWRKKNPDKARENDVRCRYRRYRAIPSWLTSEQQEQINSIYRKCRHMTMETGIQHHVDHIVPIHGVTVCGLHVPENLQILTASENCSKRNSFDAGTLTIQDAD